MLRGSLEEMQWSTFISFSVQNHPPEAVQVAIKKGTGFLLDIGVIVTNEHVVASSKWAAADFKDTELGV
jgi:S1-C subfamily serine protease